MTSVLRVPAPSGSSVELRCALLTDRADFAPDRWPSWPLVPPSSSDSHHTVDLSTLSLADGTYEYQFVVDGALDQPVADPYATEITRFGGYRGTFTIAGGARADQPFDWTGELPAGVTLVDNSRLVIYELPVRWMDDAADDDYRQVGLGTFEQVVFERLESLAALGITAIELLPSEDSIDTINWGYGTRFFFAPDIDLGVPTDLRFLVKRCHQLGIRVLMDVVMNHSHGCPLEQLDYDAYYLRPEELNGRQAWGGSAFRYYSDPAPDPSFPAREFLCGMGEYWVNSYHVDGFRLDDFADIGNWDFVQEFTGRARAAHEDLFPDRPFFVVAEDSGTQSAATQGVATNPNGRPVVDALWDFPYYYEIDRFLTGTVRTLWGEPSRSDRLVAMLSGSPCWDDWNRRFSGSFTDPTQHVNYTTSHDVAPPGGRLRLMTRLLLAELGDRNLLDQLEAQSPGVPSWELARQIVDADSGSAPPLLQALTSALDRIRSAFVLLLTSAGIPMFLAGEEFGDCHDLDPTDWQQKMSDPVNWGRGLLGGHAGLRSQVADLIALRVSSGPLAGPEVEVFYRHPQIDDDSGPRVAGWARTGGRPLGSSNQVVVLANLGPADFPAFTFPEWPWSGRQLVERAVPLASSPLSSVPAGSAAAVSLAPFQARVFTS